LKASAVAKDFFSTIVRGDEAKVSLIKPALDGSCWHYCLLGAKGPNLCTTEAARLF
jgi:hypothetical protein